MHAYFGGAQTLLEHRYLMLGTNFLTTVAIGNFDILGLFLVQH